MIDILVTEDNKELSTLMSDFLRAEGYTVTVADSGEKALNIFEKYGARLVLLDIMLRVVMSVLVTDSMAQISRTAIVGIS